VAAVRELLEQYPTLYEAAAADPDSKPISGRGIAYAIRLNSDPWLVRHYRRGGMIARVLNDRYAPTGNRAVEELKASVVARARGIPTPEVVAAICYSGPLYSRFDIAVQFIDHSRDLAQLLFEDRVVSTRDIGKAATLIRTMIKGGLLHADLNLKNILIAPDRAYVLDLDRCTVVDEATRHGAEAMRKRFARSLAKWESKSGRVVSEAHHRTLEAAFHD
jgi:3-deoxy-D-manno-octulosonic acid kinase